MSLFSMALCNCKLFPRLASWATNMTRFSTAKRVTNQRTSKKEQEKVENLVATQIRKLLKQLKTLFFRENKIEFRKFIHYV